ncbi:MAG TPA: transcriptional repressor [Saprospiraceae bacterium]|nr:transcriptional repressor [Saprospiraceae bacterium]
MDATTYLKKAGLKLTPVRLRMVEIFDAADHALHQQEIESGFDGIDRITLYRTLKSFEEKGLIHKITDLDGNSKYAMCESECLEHHHHHHHAHIHFQCDHCHLTYCVENVEIPNIEIPGKFLVTGQNITITGKCENCQ